ncbi:hypothetical protein HMPREF8577_0736 [Streptococcus parasanguinis ATCC 903]|uniref:Uncharacterized protein n=1 Tax=Streptococcus parasanguinis TaxID=1318 RepID=A0AAX4AV38_STRPA|nr:hypothetical protein [Streptococcus parasanguinis]EFX38989.1 hypothetical protein HMPREF8577_0736 [Streptococcus parasanguinis ATCC 903]WNB82513.1 hypothetical protein RDV49_06240 [Streptococcus parasanguinis]
MVKFSKIDKQLKKELNQCVRVAAKRLKLKSRSERFFDKVGDYLVKYMIDIKFPDNQFSITIQPSIKPYMIDDIFWEVFDMDSNSQEPMSLRAVGAFTVDSLSLPYKIFKEEWTMEDLDIEKVESKVFEVLSEVHEEVLKLINSFLTFEDFYVYAVENGPSLVGYDLIGMLLLIHREQYAEALQMAEGLIANRKFGGFQNKGKWINEYIVDYCKERLGK